MMPSSHHRPPLPDTAARERALRLPSPSRISRTSAAGPKSRSAAITAPGILHRRTARNSHGIRWLPSSSRGPTCTSAAASTASISRRTAKPLASLITNPAGRHARIRTWCLRAGAELQRCLYAFAVRSLLPEVSGISSRLLYLKAADDGLYSLTDPDAVLTRLAEFSAAAARLAEAGNLLPGPAAAGPHNDFAFALPGSAKETYFDLKFRLITKRLADLAPLWEME